MISEILVYEQLDTINGARRLVQHSINDTVRYQQRSIWLNPLQSKPKNMKWIHSGPAFKMAFTFKNCHRSRIFLLISGPYSDAIVRLEYTLKSSLIHTSR